MLDNKKQRLIAMMEGWLPHGTNIDEHALAIAYGQLCEFRYFFNRNKSVHEEHVRILGFELKMDETSFLRLLYAMTEYELRSFLRFIVSGYVADVDRTVLLLQKSTPQKHEQIFKLVSAKQCMETSEYKHCPGKHALLDAIYYIPLKHENFKIMASTEMAARRLQELESGKRSRLWLAHEIYDAASLKGAPRERRSAYKKIQAVDAMDILARLEMNPEFNDVSLELGILFDEICRCIDPKVKQQTLALVNVSPLLVKRVMGEKMLKNIPLVVVEPTLERRDLMRKSKRVIRRSSTEAPVTCVSTVDELCMQTSPAVTVMVCGTEGEFPSGGLVNYLNNQMQNLADDCKIIALQSISSCKKTPVEFRLVGGTYCVKREVHLFPQDIPRLKRPKRKALTIYSRETQIAKEHNKPHYVNHRMFKLEDRLVLDQISAAELNMKRVSLSLKPLDITDRQAFEDAERTLRKREIEERRTPNVYYLAPELPIEYIVDEKYLTACFCYPKAKKNNEIFGTCGRRIQNTFRRIRDRNIIQSGLSFVVNDYPYSFVSKGLKNERSIRDTVAQERIRMLKGKPITLRALWYLYPSEELFVENDRKYIQSILASSLGLLVPGESSKDEMIQQAEVYADKQKKIGIRTIFRLLGLLIDIAVEKKHCLNNVLKNADIPVRSKKRNRKQEVTRFMHVRSLPNSKMLQLFKLLESELGTNPLSFGAILRFLTGLSANILCALQYRSIQRITGYAGYYMSIIRQVTNDGNTIKNFEKAFSKMRFPFPEYLEKYFLELKKDIEQSGVVTAMEVGQLPLLSYASKADFSEQSIRNSITPRQLEKYCRDKLRSIGMPARVIDYHLPNKGTIELHNARGIPNFPQSNLVYNLSEDGKTEEADLAYLTSRKGPDILSMHYVGYTSMGMLYNMRAVLERWYSTFTKHESNKGRKSNTERVTDSVSFKHENDGKRLGKVLLELQIPKGQVVRIKMQSEFGVRVNSL